MINRRINQGDFIMIKKTMLIFAIGLMLLSGPVNYKLQRGMANHGHRWRFFLHP